MPGLGGRASWSAQSSISSALGWAWLSLPPQAADGQVSLTRLGDPARLGRLALLDIHMQILNLLQGKLGACSPFPPPSSTPLAAPPSQFAPLHVGDLPPRVRSTPPLPLLSALSSPPPPSSPLPLLCPSPDGSGQASRRFRGGEFKLKPLAPK